MLPYSWIKFQIFVSSKWKNVSVASYKSFMNFIIKFLKIVMYICKVIVKKIHINYKIHYNFMNFSIFTIPNNLILTCNCNKSLNFKIFKDIKWTAN
jgi:hypothetical protein